MDDELSPGDLAIIIESVLGKSVGEIVQCVSIAGEHTVYGTMWLVASTGNLVSEYGQMTNRLHQPAKWLKKIKPGDLDKKAEIKKLSESDLIKELLGEFDGPL